MDIRRNHRDLSPADKQRFVQAVLSLKNNVDSILHPGQQARYDDFVEVHRNAMDMGPTMIDPMPHGTSLFYPWHRILLRQFELALQAAIEDPSVTIPYWDWSLGSSDPFTPDFLGGDGDRAQALAVTNGPFAYTAGQFPIRLWDAADDMHVQALRRDLGEDPNSWLPTPEQVIDGLGRTPYWGGRASFESVSESQLHNPVHRWVAGNMADACSPNDPVFFLHHAYIDLLWERWQPQHPTLAPYLPSRPDPSFALGATLVFNAAGAPAPWAGHWTVAQTVSAAALGYSYA